MQLIKVKMGAYGLDLGATGWRSVSSFDENPTRTGDSADFNSLEALLQSDFTERCGQSPEIAVLALPGTYGPSGLFEFTNLDWPGFRVGELGQAFGMRVELINDLQAAKIGVALIDRSRLVTLKEGDAHVSRYACVLTLSTGVNWNTGERGDSLSLAREGGHIMLALPTGRLHTTGELADFVSKRLGAPASIENLLSGSQGVDHIADFLLMTWSGRTVNPVRTQLAERRAAGLDSAPLMTKGVMEGHPFWMSVAMVYGTLLGYLINQIVVGELVGELYIQGSVLNGTPGFAEWLFANTVVGRVLVGRGMAKSFVAEEVSIFAVPNDLNMAARGARRHAEVLLAGRSK